MAKTTKQKPDTWIDDARQRVENVLYMPFEYKKEAANQILTILKESKTEAEYFERIKDLKI